MIYNLPSPKKIIMPVKGDLINLDLDGQGVRPYFQEFEGAESVIAKRGKRTSAGHGEQLSLYMDASHYEDTGSDR